MVLHSPFLNCNYFPRDVFDLNVNFDWSLIYFSSIKVEFSQVVYIYRVQLAVDRTQTMDEFGSKTVEELGDWLQDQKFSDVTVKVFKGSIISMVASIFTTVAY